MADDNQQWPSEGEDFDAVSDNKSSNSMADVTPQAKSVTVTTPDDEKEEPVPAEPEQSEDEPEEEPKEEKQPEREEEPMNNDPTPTPAKSGAAKSGGNVVRTVLEVILLVIVVGLGLWAWTLHSDNTDLKKQVASLSNNPQVTIQKQTQALITKVSKLIQLPSGETPTIANVTDADAAKKQSAFFNNAQNGDKVLMYVKAGEAILYRPSTNKIILVAPLTFNNTSSTTGTTPTTSTTHKK